jgi:Leucine-rich repeat (LRR) protein
MSVQSNSQLTESPPAWLARLFQQLASGPGGLANAAALGQTCKFLHSLSESSAVIYRNLVISAAISSPDNPAWQWLALRSGRIAGLSLDFRLDVLGDGATEDAHQLAKWMPTLQTLSGIPGVQLRVEWVGVIIDLERPCIAMWLKQPGQLISHLKMVVHVSENRVKLRQISEAAAPCTSIDLTIKHPSNEVVDLADLTPVASSISRLTCEPILYWGILRGFSALESMSQLTALHLVKENLDIEEPWGVLAKLTNLQQLELALGWDTRGDPSPLSTLTELSSLHLYSVDKFNEDDPAPFGFSSLQPLSTLQQLEKICLEGAACAATSLQGLAGLSNLKQLQLNASELVSLEGISPAVVEVCIMDITEVVSLAGFESCTHMEQLYLNDCSAPSLQPLNGLSSLKVLMVNDCAITSLEGLNSTSLQSLWLQDCSYLIDLFGVELLSALETLVVEDCGVTSLQPLSQLGEGLQKLRVYRCTQVQEEVLELPHVQPTADVDVRDGNVREVVLAGGVRRALRPT